MSTNPVTRLYNVSSSLRALSELMDNADNPLAPLFRMISNEVEECANLVEQGQPDNDGGDNVQ